MGIWGTIAAWRGPTVNRTAGGMKEWRGVVVHIADGTFEGTIAWQRNPSADVSSHFVVARDGRVVQVVDDADAAWTQRAGNGHWLSVENEGYTGKPLSDAQVEANARILAEAHVRRGVPLQVATSPSAKGLGHHSMGYESGVDWGHSQCPGEPIKAQKAAIVARASQIINGTGGDDMALEGIDRVLVENAEHYAQALVGMIDAPAISDTVHVTTRPNRLAQSLTALHAKVDGVAARPAAALTDAQVAALGQQLLAGIDARMRAAAEAAVRKVLGAVDGATPPPTG